MSRLSTPEKIELSQASCFSGAYAALGNQPRCELCMPNLSCLFQLSSYSWLSPAAVLLLPAQHV